MNMLKPLAIAAMSIAMLMPAAATQPLPSEMTGSWCVDINNPNDPYPTILVRGKKCLAVDRIEIRRDGFSGDALNCRITQTSPERRSQFRIARNFEKCLDEDEPFNWKGAIGLRYDGLLVLEKDN